MFYISISARSQIKYMFYQWIYIYDDVNISVSMYCFYVDVGSGYKIELLVMHIA